MLGAIARLSPFGRRSQCFEVDVADAGFAKPIGQHVLGEGWQARQRNRPDIDELLDATLLTAWSFTLTAAAYNLVRLPKLLAAA